MTPKKLGKLSGPGKWFGGMVLGTRVSLGWILAGTALESFEGGQSGHGTRWSLCLTAYHWCEADLSSAGCEVHKLQQDCRGRQFDFIRGEKGEEWSRHTKAKQWAVNRSSDVFLSCRLSPPVTRRSFSASIMHQRGRETMAALHTARGSGNLSRNIMISP